MTTLEIREYSDGNGKYPFREWLTNLKDVRARARIRTRLDRLSLGHYGDVKSVGEGVFELRLFFGPGYRIYFARAASTVVILLCGGEKSSQTIDIARAQSYWADFRSSQ